MKLGLIVFSLLLFMAGNVRAQTDRASITGTVRDPSGAVIAGALVTAANVASSLRQTAVTNELGVYSLRNLPIGEYTLECSRVEFVDYKRSGINLDISQVAEIDFSLKVGIDTEPVTVTGDAPEIQTQTSSLSTNLVNAAITELPLNVQGGRNLSTFMFAFVPGVEGTDYDSHILGGLSQNKEVMIDGTSAVSQIGGYISESSPPMEAVQEFQVTTAGIRADDGRTGGGVFRYDMKSGSNAWHGSGFFYMHNEAFDARSWGDEYNEAHCLNARRQRSGAGRELPARIRQTGGCLYSYGASVGGPIKKGKLFFYSACGAVHVCQQGHRCAVIDGPDDGISEWGFQRPAQTNRSCSGRTAPVKLCIGGAIIDPLTGDAFPGNIIPRHSISAVSKKIVALYRQYYQPLSSGLDEQQCIAAQQPGDLVPKQSVQHEARLRSVLESSSGWIDHRCVHYRACFPTRAASGRPARRTAGRWRIRMITTQLRRPCASGIPGRFRTRS